MSDEVRSNTEEQEATVEGSDAEEPIEDEEDEPDDVLAQEPMTLQEGKRRVLAAKDEAVETVREMGTRPWKQMVGSYVERVVDGVLGAADGLAGLARKNPPK